MKVPLRLGTRGSALAMAQSGQVAAALTAAVAAVRERSAAGRSRARCGARPARVRKSS